MEPKGSLLHSQGLTSVQILILKSMNPVNTLPTYSLKIYFNITITELVAITNYRSFTRIGNLNVPEFKGLFHRRVSKSQPATSKQTSHLLKMFLNTWCCSCLEIKAISLQIFSFSSCKGCGLFTKFFFTCPSK